MSEPVLGPRSLISETQESWCPDHLTSPQLSRVSTPTVVADGPGSWNLCSLRWTSFAATTEPEKHSYAPESGQATYLIQVRPYTLPEPAIDVFQTGHGQDQPVEVQQKGIDEFQAAGIGWAAKKGSRELLRC